MTLSLVCDALETVMWLRGKLKSIIVHSDRKTMRQNIFEYIEVDYNKKRRHSSLGYLT